MPADLNDTDLAVLLQLLNGRILSLQQTLAYISERDIDADSVILHMEDSLLNLLLTQAKLLNEQTINELKK